MLDTPVGDAVMHQAEMEIIAIRVAEKTAERMALRMPEIMAPKIYEIAEKVSERNSENFRTTMRIVLGVDSGNEESIRKFRQDLDWVRERRINEALDRRVVRSASIKAFVTHFCSGIMGSGIMLWLVQHLSSNIAKMPSGG